MPVLHPLLLLVVVTWPSSKSYALVPHVPVALTTVQYSHTKSVVQHTRVMTRQARGRMASFLFSSKNSNERDIGENMTDSLSKLGLEDLEGELIRLQRELEEQKGTYEQQIHILEEESNIKVRQAEDALANIRSEFVTYIDEVDAKFDAAPAAEDVARMQREMMDLQERADAQQNELAQAKAKLADNLEARKQLQAEMVTLKHGYLQTLTDTEDQLENEQDQRVRDQQEAAKTLEKVQSELKQRLRDTIEESKRQVEVVTADFKKKLDQRDEDIQQTRLKRRELQHAITERESRIATLESERKSLRQLLAITLRLIRQRLANRFTARRRRTDSTTTRRG